MLAVLKDKPEPGSLIVGQAAVPQLQKGCLIAKVDAVGICGTDVHIYKWESSYHDRLGGRLPMIMGHEFTGVITEIDGESPEMHIGDRIVASPGVACGECYFCRTGNKEICQNRMCTGIETAGAMAEYVMMQKENCFVLPADFPPDVAAAIEPMSIAYNGLHKAGSLLSKDVVVIGPGTIGYFTCLFAYLAGAASISIIGLPQDEGRLQVFRAQIPAIKVYTDGGKSYQSLDKIGADIVFEVSGSRGGLSCALELAKKRALIVAIGIADGRIDVDMVGLVRKELVLCGTHAMSTKLWMELINLLVSLPQDQLAKFAVAITHRYPISEAAEAFRAAASFTGMKVLIMP